MNKLFGFYLFTVNSEAGQCFQPWTNYFLIETNVCINIFFFSINMSWGFLVVCFWFFCFFASGYPSRTLLILGADLKSIKLLWNVLCLVQRAFWVELILSLSL